MSEIYIFDPLLQRASRGSRLGNPRVGTIFDLLRVARVDQICKISTQVIRLFLSFFVRKIRLGLSLIHI